MSERRVEYDFLKWTSFPSSIKLFNPTTELPNVWVTLFGTLSVKSGSRLTVSVQQKVENVIHESSYCLIEGFDGSKWRWLTGVPPAGVGGAGTYDFQNFERSVTVPSDIVAIRCKLMGAGGLPATTWYDDLKIYQDDMLIYANDFSKWDPLIGAGIGAGVLGAVVPAVVRVPEPGVAYEYQKPMLEKEPLWAAGLAGLGALIGGGVGLLTAMGIFPVPQIPPLPALEAPPEGARLGKYVVSG